MSRNNTPARTPFLSVHSNPIYIEDENVKNNGKYVNSIATITRLPQFQPDDKITKLLYSKFIVKGVKPINQEAIMSKLRNNTSHNQRKVTRETTNYTKDHITKQRHTKALRTKQQSCDKSQDRIFEFSMQNCLRKSLYVNGAQNIGQDQKFRFQRSMSAKNVRRPQTAVQRSASTKLINRPQSAFEGQKMMRSGSKSRPQTALSRSSSHKKTLSRYYEYEQTEAKPNILKISQSNPKFITVDYIEKNKRELSSKKKSVYITAPQCINNVKVNREQIKSKIHSNPIDNFLFEKKSHLTEQQKQRITQRQRQYLRYMKQNMPFQYQDCVSYLSKMSENFQQQEHSLLSLSIGEEQPLSLTSKQIEEEQVKQFYHNFLNKCIDIEYALKKTEIKKQKKEQSQTILNIHQTETLLALYKKLKKLKQECLSCESINQQIKRVVRNLSFFKNLKPEMLKKVFEMDYEIKQIEQNLTLIEGNSQIKYIYIILNGSVTKKNQKDLDEQQDILIDKIQPPEFWSTLFDGEAFGFPNKVTDKILTYSIRTAEKCLLMVLPFASYRSALRSNQSLEDMVNILKQVFPSNSNKFKLNNQDYESLAFQMQTKNYSALEIIVREGQPFENLIIVANGSVQTCFQSIIKRKKETQYNGKRKKSLREKKEIKIEQLRKNNLYNYQLLCQDQEQMQYYYCEKVEQKIRGDVVNWKGFENALSKDEYEENTHKMSYSLMSIQDITKVYTLSPQNFESLSDHLKEILKAKMEKGCKKQTIKRDQEKLNKWQNYKIKICQQILKNKQNKLY